MFWVHASNAARFEQSFREIADFARIPGRNDPGSNILELIENWLWHAKGDEKWLLVLDNADSDDVFQIVPKKANSQSRNDLADSSRKPLIEYVPRTPHGAVIITSRVREFALGMVNDRTLIEVKPMERKIGWKPPGYTVQHFLSQIDILYKGMWKEAEELLLNLINIYKTLDNDYPEAQVALANLTVTYQKQGRWEEAAKFFQEQIGTSKKKPRLRSSWNNNEESESGIIVFTPGSMGEGPGAFGEGYWGWQEGAWWRELQHIDHDGEFDICTPKARPMDKSWTTRNPSNENVREAVRRRSSTQHYRGCEA